METQQIIEVLQAHQQGKQIQWKFADGKIWSEVVTPSWNFERYDYRVKPEPPRPREWWIGICPQYGNHEKLFAVPPNPQCPECQIIHVIEVLPDQPSTQYDSARLGPAPDTLKPHHGPHSSPFGLS